MIVEILTFLLVLSILVLVHEFGHFWVARRNGVWVEEFGFGLPPRVLSKKVGDTIYSINLLPFGGFVRLHGENSGDSVVYPNKSFLNKSKKVRASIVVAGVVMNFLLAIVSFAILYSHFGIPKDLGYVQIAEITPNSPAAATQITVGQRIFAFNGNEISESTEITQISNKGGKHVLIVGEVDAKEEDRKKITIETRYDEAAGKWYMGLSLTSEVYYHPPIWQVPFYGAYYGTKSSLEWVGIVWDGLTGIAQDASQGKVPEGVAGPLGIYEIIENILKNGNKWDLINLVGILSINLAVLNIIPFPALDGGRLLFILLEKIFGRKVLPKLENVIHTVGMIILLLAIIAITISDVKRIITTGN